MTDKKDKIFDADKYYKENVEPYIESQGTKKMWNYFLDVMKKDYFVETIRELRKKYKIPPNGFDVSTRDSYVMPPQGFDRNNEGELRKDIIEKICKKYKLHYFDFSDVLLTFVCYDLVNPLGQLGTCGLFWVSDVVSEKEEPFDGLCQQSDDMAYPIAIRISPYASQRDIIDFIKNKVVWKKEIEFLQNKYKDENIKIGKIKNKNEEIQKRNDFIYNNKHKSLKEISKMLADKNKNWIIDQGHIGKIISLEKQKRKEV
jgi:hypothetical protein